MDAWTRRTLPVGALLAAMLAFAQLPGQAGAQANLRARAASAAGGALLSTTVDPSARSLLPARRIPGSFLGFSIEYNSVLDYTGSYVPGIDVPFASVVSQLGQFRGGLPSLRFGGVTTDQSWWDPNHKPNPTGIHFAIGRYWVDGVSRFEQAERTPLIFGLNLGKPSPSYALSWARAATHAFGHRVTFEYGNEPDLYGMSFPFTDTKGQRAYTTPLRRNWSFGAYVREFSRKAAKLHRAVRGIRLGGPSTISFSWDRAIPAFVAREHTRISMATAHVYPMCTCVSDPRQISHVTLDHILSPQNVFNPLMELSPALASARRHRLPFRVTEAGVISGGGGRLGGTFAGALWGLDFMFALGESGGSGVNFHTSGSYLPLTVAYTGQLGNGGHWVMTSHPLLYAMLLFARATGDGARFLPDSTFLRSRRRAGANILVWATVNRAHVVHVVVVNEDRHDAGQIRIRIPAGRGNGSVIRLTAPSPRATSGTTLAGQSWPKRSSDGVLHGRYLARAVKRHGSTYSFRIGPTSAALLSVRT